MLNIWSCLLPVNCIRLSFSFYCFIFNLVSSISLVTGLQLGRPASPSLISGRSKYFCLLSGIHKHFGVYPSSDMLNTGGRGGASHRWEKAMNAWSEILTSVYIIKLRCLIKQRAALEFYRHALQLFICPPLSVNTFAASYLNNQGLSNSCLKSPASTLFDLFQSRALRSFSLNQLRNLSL